MFMHVFDDDVVLYGVDCDVELGMSDVASVVQKHAPRNNCNTTVANLSKQSISTQVHHARLSVKTGIGCEESCYRGQEIRSIIVVFISILLA
jgi:hypothetical protein